VSQSVEVTVYAGHKDLVEVGNTELLARA